MKKIIKAFTLIELLIVTTIITVISSAWIFYFLDFIQDQEISQKLYVIEDNLKNLDKQVKNYEIFDYEIIFNPINSTKFYKTYTNIYDSDKQLLFLDDSWNGRVLWTLYWTWILKIYKNEKLFINIAIDRTANYDYVLNEYPHYKISWTASWNVLNDVYIDYFSESNIFPEENNDIILTSINTQKDKSWIDITNLKVTNVWWIKKFYDNWTEEPTYNNVFLFFDNNWKEKFIKISK